VMLVKTTDVCDRTAARSLCCITYELLSGVRGARATRDDIGPHAGRHCSASVSSKSEADLRISELGWVTGWASWKGREPIPITASGRGLGFLKIVTLKFVYLVHIGDDSPEVSCSITIYSKSCV